MRDCDYPEPGMMPMDCSSDKSCNVPCRENAKQVLLGRAKRLREAAHNIEKLADEIGNLSPAADEALWQLVIGSKQFV
jgi:hypothetical protein